MRLCLRLLSAQRFVERRFKNGEGLGAGDDTQHLKIFVFWVPCGGQGYYEGRRAIDPEVLGQRQSCSDGRRVLATVQALRKLRQVEADCFRMRGQVAR